MNIATLVFNPIQENTYVVWDDTKECVVIDAGNSNPKEDAALKNFIDERGLKPVAALPLVGVLFAWLAARAIFHDELLVRSLDRIR